MAGIYLHFPFCKQACSYCNFHFSTSHKNKGALIKSMYKEIDLRADFFDDKIIESIYFGGGSPSLLDPKTIGNFILKIKSIFKVSRMVEITLEINPDDSSLDYLLKLKENKINRLSIGVQSFLKEDLILMNRVHSVDQSFKTLNDVKHNFDNFSIDLIYGLPYSNIDKWKFNLDTALSFNPPHISSYILTVEPKTALKRKIDKGEVALIEENEIENQYRYMVSYLESLGYINYEFSSFTNSGKYSINNNGYWHGKPYLGIGPSAHSYDGKNKRSWNVKQNNLYINSIQENKLFFTEEILSQNDRFNEIIMTGLRTSSGVSLKLIKKIIGKKYADFLEENSKKRVLLNDLYWDGDSLHVSKKSKFLSDGIASELFILN